MAKQPERTARLCIRLTPAENDNLRKVADALGISKTQAVVFALREYSQMRGGSANAARPQAENRPD